MSNNNFMLPLAMKVAAKTIGMNLVNVQPMTPPIGELYMLNGTSHPDIEEDEDGILRIFIRADLGFIGICNTILYSTDEEQVAYAYNELFTSYKSYLTWGANSISKSCLEEVIYKILNDALKEDAFYYNGEKFSPFAKLLAIARESTKYKNRPTYSRFNSLLGREEAKVKYIDLSKIILYYAREHDDEIKDEQIKFFLKKKLTDFTK